MIQCVVLYLHRVFYVMICPIRVSCHAVADMCEQLKCPQALILEAPFNNMREEVKLNPLSQVRLWVDFLIDIMHCYCIHYNKLLALVGEKMNDWLRWRRMCKWFVTDQTCCKQHMLFHVHIFSYNLLITFATVSLFPLIKASFLQVWFLCSIMSTALPLFAILWVGICETPEEHWCWI